jgi:hypothetical protein
MVALARGKGCNSAPRIAQLMKEAIYAVADLTLRGPG